MVVFAGSTYSLRFKKVKFVEVDMIPFTQIADDCIKFKNIVTWDTAYINWDDAGLPPNGTLQIIDDSGDPTWDNFYLVGDGVNCISYMNEGINIPFVAKAPDIDYDNSNFSFISSTNITFGEIEIT
jgi:hypothetical protein